MNFRDRSLRTRVFALLGMVSFLFLSACASIEQMQQGEPNFNTAILLTGKSTDADAASTHAMAAISRDGKELKPATMPNECTDDKVATTGLDVCIYKIKSIIDDEYREYRIVLHHSVDYGDTSADVATLGFSAIATSPITTVAKTVFSGLSTFIGGAKTTVNQDVLYQKTVEILIGQMDADRDQQFTLMLKQMDPKNPNKYTWAQAKDDLLIYFAAGTWDHAITSLENKSAANQANCATQKANAKVASAQGTLNDTTKTKTTTPTSTTTTGTPTATSTGCPAPSSDDTQTTTSPAPAPLKMAYKVLGTETDAADLAKAIAGQINDKTTQADFSKAGVTAASANNVVTLTVPAESSFDWTAAVTTGKGETIAPASIAAGQKPNFTLALAGAAPVKDDVISIAGTATATKSTDTADPQKSKTTEALKISLGSHDLTNKSFNEFPGARTVKLTISGGSGTYSADVKQKAGAADVTPLVNAGTLTLVVDDSASGSYPVTITDKTANYQAMVTLTLLTPEITLWVGGRPTFDGGALPAQAGKKTIVTVKGGKPPYKKPTLSAPDNSDASSLASLSGSTLTLDFTKVAAPPAGPYKLSITDNASSDFSATVTVK